MKGCVQNIDTQSMYACRTAIFLSAEEAKSVLQSDVCSMLEHCCNMQADVMEQFCAVTDAYINKSRWLQSKHTVDFSSLLASSATRRILSSLVQGKGQP